MGRRNQNERSFAKLHQLEVSIAAGQQFLGTEFASVAPQVADMSMLVVEIDLHMGVESKTWAIRKRTAGQANQDGAHPGYLIRGATDTSTDVMMFGDENIGTLLTAGQSISITTTGATAAMTAIIYYRDVPNFAPLFASQALNG